MYDAHYKILIDTTFFFIKATNLWVYTFFLILLNSLSILLINYQVGRKEPVFVLGHAIHLLLCSAVHNRFA